ASWAPRAPTPNNGPGLLSKNRAATPSVLADIQLVAGTGAAPLPQAPSSPGPATIIVQSSVAASNSTVGIAAGANSSVRVTGSTISNNAVGRQTPAGHGPLRGPPALFTPHRPGGAAGEGGHRNSAGHHTRGRDA